MECYLKIPQALSARNIGRVLECLDVKATLTEPLEDVKSFLLDFLSRYTTISKLNVVFTENEPIGTNYVLYKYHVFDNTDFTASCRAIVRKNVLEEVICTFDRASADRVSNTLKSENREPRLRYPAPTAASGVAPGQYYIDHFIIYKIFGVPTINIEKWKLVVSGAVLNPLTLSLSELERMSEVKLVRDFHCVTGWSISSVQWEGVRLKLITDIAKPSEGVRWVLIHGLDGYVAVVPFEDFISEEALLVLKLNGKPLSIEQGYPARIFIPHLYGWKSVKWVNRIEFTYRYTDGYWEALGYHERGNVFLEERFKEIAT
ncbi:MAG: molybdopterin-dependent oxidoreductase [Sulfolobales archaeon]|nr:molybdopterin-dependent oxidoreductase [Sulfolobales archaeon]MDW8083083.1 molybdopterin-dependent oxidoreductase [Sulfolobales archaeon]